MWVPLSSGIPSDAVSIFHLEQADGRTFLVASRVEVFALPAVDRSSIEQNSNESLIAKEWNQV
jgi:hypothetical protein